MHLILLFYVTHIDWMLQTDQQFLSLPHSDLRSVSELEKSPVSSVQNNTLVWLSQLKIMTTKLQTVNHLSPHVLMKTTVDATDDNI